MATFYGTNTTNIVSAPPSDGTKLDAGQTGQKVRTFIEQVDLETNDVDNGDDIVVARLPERSRIIKAEVYSNASTDASSATGSLGNSTSATAYSPAITLGAAGAVVTLQGDSAGDEIEAQTDIYLTIGTADLPNASGDGLTVVVYFTTPD